MGTEAGFLYKQGGSRSCTILEAGFRSGGTPEAG